MSNERALNRYLSSMEETDIMWDWAENQKDLDLDDEDAVERAWEAHKEDSFAEPDYDYDPGDY